MKAAPVVLTAPHPLTGEPFSFPFTVADFGFFVQYGAYRELPRLIYDIYDGGYRQVITAREDLIREARHMNAGQHFGFRTTMACNEPWQTISAEQRAAMGHTCLAEPGPVWRFCRAALAVRLAFAPLSRPRPHRLSPQPPLHRCSSLTLPNSGWWVCRRCIITRPNPSNPLLRMPIWACS